MPDFHPSLDTSLKMCCLDWGIEKVSPYSRSTKPLGRATVLLSLVLHQLPFGEGVELLQELLYEGNAVLIADYKLPERNLDYPAYWLSCLLESVGTHQQCYRDFIRYGGIEGIISRLGIIPQRRSVLWGGGIGFVWICDKGEK